MNRFHQPRLAALSMSACGGLTVFYPPLIGLTVVTACWTLAGAVVIAADSVREAILAQPRSRG